MSTQIEIDLMRICQSAAEKKASEIYLIPAQVPFIRIDGQMQSMAKENIISVSFINGLIKSFLNEQEQLALQNAKQVEIIQQVGKLGSGQINIYFQKGVPSVRVKLLDQEIAQLSNLELPQMVKGFVNQKKGIVFITGPRDSGRSTMLSYLINEINKNQVKFIATVEKPIKSVISGIKSVIEQREVGKDVDSFLNGLRYIRTRNVDVVVINKVENNRIINELFSISEAGTLVFAIMDTESVIKTIKRILRFFPKEQESDIRYFLSESLVGVVCSHLVPRIGGGRIRAMEILTTTPAIKSIIAAGKFHQLAGTIQAAEDRTSISLDQYLADLVMSNKITAEKALDHCANQEILRALLKR